MVSGKNSKFMTLRKFTCNYCRGADGRPFEHYYPISHFQGRDWISNVTVACRWFYMRRNSSSGKFFRVFNLEIPTSLLSLNS